MVGKKKSAVRGLTCAMLCAAATVSLSPQATSAPNPRPNETGQALKERYHATRHGGIATAANASITCRKSAAKAGPCGSAQKGGSGRNSDFDMFYSDVDRDRNTYNSTRATLRLPKKAEVSYARLYWGGNLRVGEVKPAKDNGRALMAEPRGSYRSVKADTVRTHRRADGADAYQASANVTSLVRKSGPGAYTVAQLNVAKGRSKAGAWGGWTLVVAYENKKSPLRHLSVWDGFAASERNSGGMPVAGPAMEFPAGAKGSVGVVGYDGDRGAGGESLTVSANKRAGTRISNSANPRDDLFNSTITDRGREVAGRAPAYRNTLGYDSDVLDAREALRAGGNRLQFRFASGDDDYLLGALFAQVDARR
ncbi:DUF3344 domain-containing protein [Streptomyces sp. HNM0575]|uniref:DUF3344 domain-containing protein n=1 Tax=Streptomyces sp. HNM0575 TaxID=2716338 RepID=UPI00145D9F63|nr:DUF3344 domain-containing protein [Streptomyces sp. HNM0575]NLU72558.1 DUF3344 domain-containing protein [Streptomyces sp. HNM0575]